MKNRIHGVLLQSPTSHSPFEIAACRAGALLTDIPALNVPMEGLKTHVQHLLDGYMPVGSVEYVRECMELAGMAVPSAESYPKALAPVLHRKVWRSRGLPTKRAFIKPAETCKLFTGFVYDPQLAREDYTPHDQEQLDRVGRLPVDVPLHVSEEVVWVSERRYYIQRGQLIGQGRYDIDGADKAPLPSVAVLRQCVDAMGRDKVMAIDLGVLSTGQTALVEATDAWSVGLYGRALEPRQYLAFLASRWEQIAAGRADLVGA
jgi:hypothetical protein